MSPDILIINQHISEAAFQTGIDKGMWGIEFDDPARPSWPYIILWVAAADKENCPSRYHFRFDLNGYPNNAPTACPWNIVTNTTLSANEWPKGKKFVSKTFNPAWKPSALYAPCDRVAMPGHEGWRQQFPELWWQPTFKITIYLNFIYRLLNSTDYATS